MLKRKYRIGILLAFFVLLACGCKAGTANDDAAKEIQFESLYVGFHPMFESEFLEYMRKESSAFKGGLPLNIICNEALWNIWIQENYPELSTYSEAETLFDIDWEAECLMVYTSNQWLETDIAEHPIASISIVEDQISIIESDTILAMQWVKYYDKEDDLYTHIYYVPYEIIKVSRKDLPSAIVEQYSFAAEYQALEFQNAYAGFFNTIEVEDWFADDFTIGIIDNEEDWDQCRTEKLRGIGATNRQEIIVDWNTQMILLYVPLQDDSKDTKCPMVEQIYNDGKRIYVQESDIPLTIPYYDKLPHFEYHPFQVLIINRDELPEELIEQYRIP